MFKKLLVLGAVLALAVSPASAAVTTFFGEDIGLGEGTPLPAFPNASAAQASFLSQLIGVGTENFEGIAAGTPLPIAISFGAAGTATLSGAGSVVAVTPGTTNGVGRYATSGSNFVETTSDLLITFSAPVAAFGFFGIDIGDFAGQVIVTTAGGLVSAFNVGTPGVPGGGVLFWGIISTSPLELISSIQFSNTAAGVDFFGFDDFTIGSIEQVRAVPEPGTVALLGLGLVGVATLARRRRQ